MAVVSNVYRGAVLGAVTGMLGQGAVAQDLPPPAERVQRQAENPLRWIVEAGKLKTRAKVAEPVAPARAAPAKPVARSAAVRPADRVVATAPAAAGPDVVAEAAPAAEATTEAAVAERPVAVPPVALELLEGADPELPDAIDAALDADAVLDLAVLVLADGSVGAVSTLASTHPAVDEHAIDAVRRWRFKPLPQALVRHVELVFHPRH